MIFFFWIYKQGGAFIHKEHFNKLFIIALLEILVSESKSAPVGLDLRPLLGPDQYKISIAITDKYKCIFS